MDESDWKRIEELVHQAGGVANAPSGIPDNVRADAMSFHTLGLVALDLKEQVTAINDRLARLEAPADKPLVIGTPYGY